MKDHPILGSIPTNPTVGWIRSALEKLGVPNRGLNFSEAQLVALLKDRGIEVGVADDDRKDRDR